MIWRALIFIFFSSPALAAPLDLRATLALALQNAPRFNTAEREAELAEIGRKNARAAFLPKVDLSTSVGVRGKSPAQGDSWAPTSAASATLSETLYDNGDSIAGYRIATLAETQSKLNLLETRDQLFLEIVDCFFQFSYERRALAVQEQQFEALRRQFELVDAGYRQGLRTRKDYLRFRSERSRAEIDLTRARNNLNLARQELQRLVGSEAPLDFALDASPPPLQIPPALVLKDHRQWRIAELEAEAQRLRTGVARRKFWPELLLTAGASWNDSNYIGTSRRFREQDQADWFGTVTLRYNLLDWGVRRREGATAAIQEEIAANNRRDRLLRLEEDMNKLRLNHGQLLEDFRLSQERLELETSSFSLLSQEYRQGKVQYLDYITSLRDQASANLSYQTSVYELKKSYYRQQYHLGRLHEAIFGP